MRRKSRNKQCFTAFSPSKKDHKIESLGQNTYKEGKNAMIKKNTIEYKIVSLIGLAGEMQTEDLYRLKYGKEYIRKAISRLNSNGLVKIYKYDGIKCLRLTTKCKNYLKENFPERFYNIFIGATATNKIRNDEHRRVRYHRLGKVLTLLYLADVKIFSDEKTLIKNTTVFTSADNADRADYSMDNNTAEFYTSTELKNAGLFMNARTSRALGVIYSHPDVYIIYNVADGIFKWENKTEESFFYRARDMFLGDITKNHFNYPKLICVGKNMDAMINILNAKNNGIKKVFDVRNNYDNIFFLDSSKFAPEQLKYFIDGNRQIRLNKQINNQFSADDRFYKYYSKTEDRTIVANFTTCNLTAIKYIKETNLKNGENANILCFNFQLPQLKNYFGIGDNVKYYQVNSTNIFSTSN